MSTSPTEITAACRERVLRTWDYCVHNGMPTARAFAEALHVALAWHRGEKGQSPDALQRPRWHELCPACGGRPGGPDNCQCFLA